MTKSSYSLEQHNFECKKILVCLYLGVFFHLQVSFALTKCIFLDLQVPEHSRIQIQFKIYPTEYGTLLVLR